MRGGYKLIDLQNKLLTTTSYATIEGIYETIENSYGKALMVTNINIDNVEKNDIFVIVDLSGTSFTFSAYGYTFTISENNQITITQ